MAPGTKKTSISLKPELVDWAEVRAAELGFENSFSAYVAWLIQRDRKANNPETFAEESVIYSSATTSDTDRIKRKHTKPTSYTGKKKNG